LYVFAIGEDLIIELRQHTDYIGGRIQHEHI